MQNVLDVYKKYIIVYKKVDKEYILKNMLMMYLENGEETEKTEKKKRTEKNRINEWAN